MVMVTMNVKMIRRVADAIEKYAVKGAPCALGFNMIAYASGGYIDHSPNRCGTTACIAGWTVQLKHRFRSLREFRVYEAPNDTFGEAQRILGLGFAAADKLFLPHECVNITPAHAVATLRHLADTGEVDWSVAWGWRLRQDSNPHSSH